MLFEFYHKENACTAFVNEKSVQPDKPFTIYILDYNYELGYELTFLPQEDSLLHSSSLMRTRHPQTYSNICHKLNSLFAEYNFPHVY
jgi:hypothetical protein